MTKKKDSKRVKTTVRGELVDITCVSERDANLLRKIIDELQSANFPANQHVKPVHLAKAWCCLLDKKKSKKRDSGTVENAMKPLRLMGPLLMREVESISSEEFAKAFSEATNFYTGKPLSVKTLEGYAITLREVLKVAVELGAKGILVDDIYEEVISAAKINGTPEKEYSAYTPRQVQQWLDSEEKLDVWVRLWIRAALASFKRPGELLALGWADINWDTGEILINKQVTSGRFKWGLKGGAPTHHVKMNAELRDVFTKLKEWQDRRGIKSDWVFASTSKKAIRDFPEKQGCPYKGRPLSRMLIKIRVQQDQKNAELPIKKLHDTRRTAATNYYLKSKADFKKVMLILKKKLNHSSILVTQEYISASLECLEDLEEEIERADTMKALPEEDIEEQLRKAEAKNKLLKIELENKKMQEELDSAA